MKFFPKPKLLIGLVFVALFAGVFLATTQPAFAAAGSTNSSPCTLPTSGSFLNFPHWWEYLQGENLGARCTPFVSWPSGVWAIGLAILDILLRVAGIAAVVSLMVSSVMYVTSSGSPDRTSAALNRIINSLVGLAIVLVAAGIVGFIGNRLA